MGVLNKKFGITLLGGVAEGQCPVCAATHSTEQPHNKGSLYYQYNFFDEHGRWPTWQDAMAHCSDEVKAYWTQALEKQGVKTNG